MVINSFPLAGRPPLPLLSPFPPLFSPPNHQEIVEKISSLEPGRSVERGWQGWLTRSVLVRLMPQGRQSQVKLWLHTLRLCVHVHFSLVDPGR